MISRVLGLVVGAMTAFGCFAAAPGAPCTFALEEQVRETPPAAKPATGSQTLETPALERDARGFVRIGTVRFHPEDKIVEADGYFNLRHGILEFLACSPGEKAHETLIAVECDPIDLNAAMILLDLKKGRLPESDGDLRPIEGDRVMALLRWETKDEAGKTVSHEMRAEDCILNVLVEDTMERCGFVYTGSFFREMPLGEVDSDEAAGEPSPAPEVEPGKRPQGAKPEELRPPTGGAGAAPDGAVKEKTVSVFAAKYEGQLIALGHRPPALCNNPLELPYPDFDYYCYSDVLPPRRPDEGVPVTLILRRPREGEIDYAIKRVKWPVAPPASGQEKETPADGDADAKDSDSGKKDE